MTEHPGLKVGLIAYLALLLLGKVGLIVMVWRAVKDFLNRDSERANPR